jgi:eukaryotic-like serine/threonine-protein kinase
MVGDVIAGKYRIDGIAGEGGMGIVYEAEHLVLGQRVAIKIVLPGALGSAEAVERFCLEARAAAKIESDHVVRVIDAASLPTGEPYLVMEYLAGCDLAALLEKSGPLPSVEVVDYALQALEGLAHAHANSVIHRDLKPANLFLAKCADGRELVKVLDFGLSKSLALPDDGRLTGPRILGSPAYMSPEQLRNADLEPRSDLWSLGVVVYELVCGKLPFVGKTVTELLVTILEADPIPLFERARNIPPALSEIVARCLRKNAADRWGNAGELAAALAPYSSGAWTGVVERIDGVFKRAAERDAKSSEPQRRFDSYELALQDLEKARSTRPRAESEPVPVSVASTLPPAGAEAPNTRVTRLPARPAPTTEKPALRILLIEDSEIALAVHDSLLRRAGFDVRTTMSVGEFDVLLEGWAPHLVLMDIEMPEVSGDMLCLRVKERVGASVPIVLLSGSPPDVLARRGRTGRADAYLSKDTTGADFVEYVRNICAITYSPEDLP